MTLMSMKGPAALAGWTPCGASSPVDAGDIHGTTQMSDTAFNCATCGHSVSKHTVKMWPSFTRFCIYGDCNTGYLANWKKDTTDG